jgi:hypothetical protein
VPGTRLPSLDLGDPVVVDEGDDPDATATVGYTLDRPAPADAHLVVSTTAYTTDAVQGSVDVRVPAGATGGTFEVPVPGNEVDSVRRLAIHLQAFAIDGIVVGDGAGRLVVRDDDPDARLWVRPVTAAVDPGDPMLWRAGLDRPVDYVVYVGAGGVVTDPRSRNLRVSDVPARWARRNLGGGLPPTAPVARRFSGLVVLGPTRPSGTIGVPTVADPPQPGRRSLTLRFAHQLLPDSPVEVAIRRR